MDYQNGLQGLGDPEVDFEGQHFLLESQFSQKWECSDHVVFCWFKFRMSDSEPSSVIQSHSYECDTGTPTYFKCCTIKLNICFYSVMKW